MSMISPVSAPSPAPAPAAAGQAVAPVTAAAQATPRRPDAPILSNPSMRLDPQLNLVVLEFYDGAGEIRAKIPSDRELRAYQMGQDPSMPGAPARIESDA